LFQARSWHNDGLATANRWSNWAVPPGLDKGLAVREAIKSSGTVKPSAGLQSARKNLTALRGLLEPSSDEL